MIGTIPIFLRIPITRELCEAVTKGKTPPNPTVVYTCRPELPDGEVVGMSSVRNRRVILGFFEAFKKFVPKDSDGFASVENLSNHLPPTDDEV
jgi:hypothetical protein